MRTSQIDCSMNRMSVYILDDGVRVRVGVCACGCLSVDVYM
jgi:hypothetical protein